MEGLILVIIISIFASIFSKSDNKKKKSMPTFGGNPNKQQQNSNESKTFTSLEDFAKEIFQELSGEKKEKAVPPIEPQVEQTNFDLEERPTLQYEKAQEVNVNKHVPREEPNVRQPVDVPSFVPTTREAVLQAVITSEILGPPKAKRH